MVRRGGCTLRCTLHAARVSVAVPVGLDPLDSLDQFTQRGFGPPNQAQSGQGAENNREATSFRECDVTIECVRDAVLWGKSRSVALNHFTR
jgi:hypothetical protein